MSWSLKYSLRAVETIDFMTAHWAHLPYDFLGRVFQPHHQWGDVGFLIVVYGISGKPQATIGGNKPIILPVFT